MGHVVLHGSTGRHARPLGGHPLLHSATANPAGVVPIRLCGNFINENAIQGFGYKDSARSESHSDGDGAVRPEGFVWRDRNSQQICEPCSAPVNARKFGLGGRHLYHCVKATRLAAPTSEPSNP